MGQPRSLQKAFKTPSLYNSTVSSTVPRAILCLMNNSSEIRKPTHTAEVPKKTPRFDRAGLHSLSVRSWSERSSCLVRSKFENMRVSCCHSAAFGTCIKTVVFWQVNSAKESFFLGELVHGWRGIYSSTKKSRRACTHPVFLSSSLLTFPIQCHRQRCRPLRPTQVITTIVNKCF
ncbi:hypothetical protein MRX96_056872 [Rhipicephalus microplus]